MAQEVMLEKEFPCPCGNGVLRVEVVEHDTWGSGRHTRSRLECQECAKNYRELRFDRVLVAREHFEEIEARSNNLFDRSRTIGQKAVERYLPQFKEHVKSLKFKTAMHDAIGTKMGITQFRKRTSNERELDEAIEEGLRRDPVRALKRINVNDVEIEAEAAAIDEEDAALKQFIEGIPKHEIPEIDPRELRYRPPA